MGRADTAPIPPQNLEAEESVLGAMMLAPGACDAVADEGLQPGDFYRESHGRILASALELHADGHPVDAITITDELEKRGLLEEVGGRPRIHELAALVPATANVRHYARIVREMAVLRDVIRHGSEAARLAWERTGDAREIVEQVQEGAFALNRSDARGEVPQVGPAVREAYERLVSMYESGRELIGVPTGYSQLDRMTSGLQPGNLIVVAARPSMGKSALALGMAAHATLRTEVPVLLFTLEMSTSEVVQRLIAHEGLVDLHKLRTGKLRQDDWASVGHVAGRLEGAPLFVDDAGAVTMLELRARARRQKLRQPDLAVVLVDYIQLMGSGSEFDSRVQEVGQISRGLKVLAQELDVAVVAVSQLSRAPEQRHDRRPQLADLRESGAIEQDADVVMLVYRDEYYNPEDPEVAGLAEVNIAKQRNGPTGTVKLTFVKHCARFSDPPPPGA